MWIYQMQSRIMIQYAHFFRNECRGHAEGRRQLFRTFSGE